MKIVFKKIRVFTITAVFLSLSNNIFSQIPSGHYDDASGLTGQTLRAALRDILPLLDMLKSHMDLVILMEFREHINILMFTQIIQIPFGICIQMSLVELHLIIMSWKETNVEQHRRKEIVIAVNTHFQSLGGEVVQVAMNILTF